MQSLTTGGPNVSRTLTNVSYPMDPSLPTRVGTGSGVLTIADTVAAAAAARVKNDAEKLSKG